VASVDWRNQAITLIDLPTQRFLGQAPCRMISVMAILQQLPKHIERGYNTAPSIRFASWASFKKGRKQCDKSDMPWR